MPSQIDLSANAAARAHLRPLFLAVCTGYALNVSAIDCQPGVWELESSSLRPDLSIEKSKASATQYCMLFGGQVELSEFRSIETDGTISFRGASIRFPDSDAETESLLWLMVGDPGYTYAQGRAEGATTYSAGEGLDSLGRYKERSETTISADGDYHFRMDRFYEQFGGWAENFNVIEGSRVTATPPDLPNHVKFDHPAARDLGLWDQWIDSAGKPTANPRRRHEQRWAILDGHAILSETVEYGQNDEVVDYEVSFETIYGEALRVVTWNLMTGKIKSFGYRQSEGGQIVGAAEPPGDATGFSKLALIDPQQGHLLFAETDRPSLRWLLRKK